MQKTVYNNISDGSGYALLWKIIKFAKKDEIIKQNSLKKLIQLALKSPSIDYPIPFWKIVPDPSLIYETNSSK